MLHFRLNGSLITLTEEDVRAHDTALTVLREKLHRCGTKEGCASGDCGACTIAIRSSDEKDSSSGQTFKSINACIMPAGQLDGLDVVTVEGLADGNTLHPVQQAMVEHHASQCGFCTPGFVMSLFSLYHNNNVQGSMASPDDHAIATALGGNLCRCTGYRPIRDAALSMHSTPGHVHDWMKQPWRSSSSKSLLASEKSENSNFYRPDSLIALNQLINKYPEARLVAGGTDLMLEATQRLTDFSALIDLTLVPELQVIDEDAQSWKIGATAPYSQLQPLFDEHYPAFGKLLERLGSQQVRNRGTLGGNIGNASPIGDTPPILLALNASVLLNHNGQQRTIPLTDFFVDYRKTALAPGEFIQSILLPKLEPDENLFVWKLSKRHDDDISAVLMAAKLRLENGIARDVRIAFGGMAAIPKRAYSVEEVLEGHSINQDRIAKAKESLAQEFTPLSDARASSDYRLMAAANLLERLRLSLSDNTIAAELV